MLRLICFHFECVQRASNGDSDAIGHALHLFLDFVSILVRVIAILSRKGKSGGNDKGGEACLRAPAHGSFAQEL